MKNHPFLIQRGLPVAGFDQVKASEKRVSLIITGSVCNNDSNFRYYFIRNNLEK